MVLIGFRTPQNGSDYFFLFFHFSFFIFSPPKPVVKIKSFSFSLSHGRKKYNFIFSPLKTVVKINKSVLFVLFHLVHPMMIITTKLISHHKMVMAITRLTISVLLGGHSDFQSYLKESCSMLQLNGSSNLR